MVHDQPIHCTENWQRQRMEEIEMQTLFSVNRFHPRFGDRMPALRRLSVARLNLANPLPASFTHLFNLRTLVIQEGVGGRFALPGLLGGLHMLRDLQLSFMALDIADDCGALLPLQSLSLFACGLKCLPLGVLCMTSLENLSLPHNSIVSLAGIGALANLRVLNVMNNCLPDDSSGYATSGHATSGYASSGHGVLPVELGLLTRLRALGIESRYLVPYGSESLPDILRQLASQMYAPLLSAVLLTQDGLERYLPPELVALILSFL